MGHLSQKLGYQVKSKENLVNTLEVTFWKQLLWILLKMFVLMISRSGLKLGQLGSKTRSPGQSKGKPCNTLEVTFLKCSSWILLKTFVLMISRWSLPCHTTYAFIKKIREKDTKTLCKPHLLSPSLIFLFKCTLSIVGYIPEVFLVILKNLSPQLWGCGFDPRRAGNILSWRFIMKYFLWSFSPFRRFKKGSCQFLAKECAQYWLTA